MTRIVSISSWEKERKGKRLKYINIFHFFYYRNQPQLQSPLIYSVCRAEWKNKFNYRILFMIVKPACQQLHQQGQNQMRQNKRANYVISCYSQTATMNPTLHRSVILVFLSALSSTKIQSCVYFCLMSCSYTFSFSSFNPSWVFLIDSFIFTLI